MIWRCCVPQFSCEMSDTITVPNQRSHQPTSSVLRMAPLQERIPHGIADLICHISVIMYELLSFHLACQELVVDPIPTSIFQDNSNRRSHLEDLWFMADPFTKSDADAGFLQARRSQFVLDDLHWYTYSSSLRKQGTLLSANVWHVVMRSWASYLFFTIQQLPSWSPHSDCSIES